MATPDDIDTGHAVFAIPGGESQPFDLHLPRCAIFTNQQTGEKTPVIVVQSENANGYKTIGYRLISGAEGVCLLSDLELLNGPDDRFK